MCRLCGRVELGSHASTRELDPILVRAMLPLLAAGGPDGQDLLTSEDEQATFGHALLNIRDFSESAHQPKEYDGIMGTYNGELYNEQEIRELLRKENVEVDEPGDTPVVFAAFRHWGKKCFKKFNWIGAAAFYDSNTKTFTAARDHMGVKAFYYHRKKDGGLTFASNIRALFAGDETLTPHIGKKQWCELLAMRRTPGMTAWDGVEELPGGCVLTYDVDGIRVEEYWKLHAEPTRYDITGKDKRSFRKVLNEAVGDMYGLLKDIMDRQLIAHPDVGVGFLLSGGLDSSLVGQIASVIFKAKGLDQHTVMVGIEGQEEYFQGAVASAEIDVDGPYARLVAQHIGSIHTKAEMSIKRLLSDDLRRETIDAEDEPGKFTDRDLTLKEMCRIIKTISVGLDKLITVLFSGEGADEIFGGYPSFTPEKIAMMVKKGLLKVEALDPEIFPWIQIFPISPTSLMKDAFLKRIGITENLHEQYHEALESCPKLEGETETEEETKRRQICWMHIKYLLPMMLWRTESISTAHGLEARVPFLDYRLVELLFNTMWKLKSYDGKEKSLERAAAKIAGLPKPIFNRPKSGYPGIPTPAYAKGLQEKVLILWDSKDGIHPFLKNEMYDDKKVRDACAMDLTKSDPQEQNKIKSGLEYLLNINILLNIRTGATVSAD